MWGACMPMGSEKTYVRLISAIYEAAVTPEKWGDFLAALSQQVGGLRIGLHCHDMSANRSLGMIHHGYDPDFIASYRAEFSSINPWTRAVIKGGVGIIQVSESIVDPDTLLRSRFYNEWLRPQEDIRTGAGVTLQKTRSRMIRLSCNIRERDRERLPALVETLTSLTPHLQSALSMTCDLIPRKYDRQLSSVLEALPGPAWVLDEFGKIFLANRLADKLHRSVDSFVNARAGMLFLNDTDADRALQRSLSGISRGAIEPLSPIVVNTGDGPLHASIAPLALSTDIEIDIANWQQIERPIAVFYLPIREGSLDRETSLREFRLTPTEAALSRALCAGETVGTYARARGVSPETARKQLKSIYSKTGLRQQSQLVAFFADAKTKHFLDAH